MSVDYDPVRAGDGEWFYDRRTHVMRWKPLPPQPVRPNPPTFDYGPVVCRCGARATETCRTQAGNRTKNHAYRSGPRVCPCGAELKWKGRLCSDCARALDIDRKRAWRGYRKETAA